MNEYEQENSSSLLVLFKLDCLTKAASTVSSSNSVPQEECINMEIYNGMNDSG